MSINATTWETALNARDDLRVYGDNAIGLFALALRFSLDDIHGVAADSLTDGQDDKKCDIIYIDQEEGVAIVLQCYYSKKEKESAPANKASDLNTALAWLLQQPIDALPNRIRSQATALRESIQTNTIKKFEVWYVHNLPEGINVQRELNAVERTLNTLSEHVGCASSVEKHVYEIGRDRLTQWYQETLSPILVSEDIDIQISDGFELKTEKWNAYVTAIAAKDLRRLFKKYNTTLFSANVRDYLGSRKTDSNINNGIKETAEHSPENFWVFNNGITILTHKYEVEGQKNRLAIRLHGASIVNGAQTTGALGSLKKMPSDAAKVPVRFVSTTDPDIIDKIVQFNNSQNKISASDFRSTDRIQKRLREEMSRIPGAEYEGGRRGGDTDAILRNKNLLPSYTVGQALAAFSGDPIVAYNRKSRIWIEDTLYGKYFNEDTTAGHIVFSYSLLKAVEELKRVLVEKAKNGVDLTQSENELLEFFRNRGATYVLTSAIAQCMEEILNKRVANLDKLWFKDNIGPKDAILRWRGVVTPLAQFAGQLSASIRDGVNSKEKVEAAIKTYKQLVSATKAVNAQVYQKFAQWVA